MRAAASPATARRCFRDLGRQYEIPRRANATGYLTGLSGHYGLRTGCLGRGRIISEADLQMCRFCSLSVARPSHHHVYRQPETRTLRRATPAACFICVGSSPGIVPGLGAARGPGARHHFEFRPTNQRRDSDRPKLASLSHRGLQRLHGRQ